MFYTMPIRTIKLSKDVNLVEEYLCNRWSDENVLSRFISSLFFEYEFIELVLIKFFEIYIRFIDVWFRVIL